MMWVLHIQLMHKVRDWFMTWVLYIQLNAHNEGLVYDAGIAYSIKCTQWRIGL